MACRTNKLSRFEGIKATAATYLQNPFAGLQVERLDDRVASGDQIVALRQSALYPPHLVVEYDVRHGHLPISVLPLQAAAMGLKHLEPSIAIGSAVSRRCLPDPVPSSWRNEPPPMS